MGITAPAVRARKGAEPPLVMLTAYDYPTACIADEAGADLILVGDTAGMVVHGWPDTIHMTVEVMETHVAAVARAGPTALVVGDLPWMSYHVKRDRTLDNAARLVLAGAGAVKLEGGRSRVEMVEAIAGAEIPVMGHLGLTPQSINALGSMRRVAGKTVDAAQRLIADARALADAGCFAIVLEAVPGEIGAMVTEAVPVPTIGIGAGPACDGQVLVLHDVIGLDDRVAPRFLRRYGSAKAYSIAAAKAFVEDVRARRYPSTEECYPLPEDVLAELMAAPNGVTAPSAPSSQ
jgi:3-methyl-2-oxobutanoate hydroxymethyltransferase